MVIIFPLLGAQTVDFINKKVIKKLKKELRKKMTICEHGTIDEYCNECLVYKLYKPCKYCKKLFLPNMANQIRCTDCQGKDFRYLKD